MSDIFISIVSLQRCVPEVSNRSVSLGQRTGNNDPDSLLHHAIHVLLSGTSNIVRIGRYRLAAGAAHLGLLQYISWNA